MTTMTISQSSTIESFIQYQHFLYIILFWTINSFLHQKSFNFYMIPIVYTYLILYLLNLSVLLFRSLHRLFSTVDWYVHTSSILKRYALYFSGRMLSDIPSYILVPFPVRLSLVWESNLLYRIAFWYAIFQFCVLVCISHVSYVSLQSYIRHSSSVSSYVILVCTHDRNLIYHFLIPCSRMYFPYLLYKTTIWYITMQFYTVVCSRLCPSLLFMSIYTLLFLLCLSLKLLMLTSQLVHWLKLKQDVSLLLPTSMPHPPSAKSLNVSNLRGYFNSSSLYYSLCSTPYCFLCSALCSSLHNKIQPHCRQRDPLEPMRR